jgi:uncharacterized damage-inducible protein DinB
MVYLKLKSGKSNKGLKMKLPLEDEYPEFYSVYVKQIPHEGIIGLLKKGRDELQSYIKTLSEDGGLFSYAEGKWSIKEVLGHMVDVERVHSYRAMCFARGETKSLPGFEQDDYVKKANFNSRSLSSIADELLQLRNANIALFESFDEETLERKGSANNYEISVRAFIFIIAGHELHHLKILKERYI